MINPRAAEHFDELQAAFAEYKGALPCPYKERMPPGTNPVGCVPGHLRMIIRAAYVMQQEIVTFSGDPTVSDDYLEEKRQALTFMQQKIEEELCMEFQEQIENTRDPDATKPYIFSDWRVGLVKDRTTSRNAECPFVVISSPRRKIQVGA